MNVVNRAIGSIEIDHTGIVKARRVVEVESRKISDTMTQIGSGARAAGVRMREFASMALDAFGQLANVMAGITLAGTAAANNLNRMNTMFRVLSGGEAAAARNMEELTELAERLNQPIQDVVEGATALLPSIRRTNADLSDAVSIAQRLAILDPAQGVEGAAFAIRELLGGEYRSLVARFELDKSRLQGIVEDAGNNTQALIDGLGEYVGELGLTEDALAEMGESGINAFAQLSSEVQMGLGEAFTPFLKDFVLPAVQGLRDLVSELRQINPQIISLAGGISSVLAAGSIAGKFGIQLPGAGTLAKAGVLGAAGVGGVGLGLGAVQAGANLGVGGLERFQGLDTRQIADEIGNTFRQLLVVVTDGFFDLIMRIRTAGADLEKALKNLIAGIVEPFDPGQAAAIRQEAVDWYQTVTDQIAADLAASRENIVKPIAQTVTPEAIAPEVEEAVVETRNYAAELKAALSTAQPAVRFTEEQLSAFADFQTSLKEIEAQAQADRLASIAAYEQRRSELLESWRQTDARREEDQLREIDATRRRLRLTLTGSNVGADMAGRLSAQIAGVESSAQAEEVEATIEHLERMAEIRSEYAERGEQSEREREQNLTDLKVAAARLDAVAVWRAQQKASQEGADEQERTLQQAVDDQQELFNQRIASIRLEGQIEAEERAVQMARAEQDRQARLAQMDAQQQADLQRIADRAEERRHIETNSFMQLHNELAVAAGQHQSTMFNIQKTGQEELEGLYRQFFEDMVGVQQAATADVAPTLEALKPAIDVASQWMNDVAGRLGNVRAGALGILGAQRASDQFNGIREMAQQIGQAIDFQLRPIIGGTAGGRASDLAAASAAAGGGGYAAMIGDARERAGINIENINVGSGDALGDDEQRALEVLYQALNRAAGGGSGGGFGRGM